MLAAGLVALLLNSLVVIIGILGGYIFSVFVQDVNPGAFAAGITLLTGIPELIISCVKAALFGLIAGLVACYRGLIIRRRRQGSRQRGQRNGRLRVHGPVRRQRGRHGHRHPGDGELMGAVR